MVSISWIIPGLMENKLKQVCLPVGCVPPTCFPYPVVSEGGVCLGDVCRRGVCLGQGVCPGGVSQHAMGKRPSPQMNRITDRCKIITLPQTSFAGGKLKNKACFMSANSFDVIVMKLLMHNVLSSLTAQCISNLQLSCNSCVQVLLIEEMH